MKKILYKKCKSYYNRYMRIKGVITLNIRDRLRTSQMRLVELATYLEISRPTLYKYLESYEKKEYNDIEKKCLDLFDYIQNTKNIQRHMIMNYLINKVLPMEKDDGSDIEMLSMVRKLTESKNLMDLKKLKIVRAIVSSNKFDDIIDILDEASNNKTKITINKFKKTFEKGEK